MLFDKQKKLHYDLMNVGLRAHATAVGLVQLCIELKSANLIGEQALERIKIAIADEVSVNAPAQIDSQEYRQDVKERLDRLFRREEHVGGAEAMAFGIKP
jgi:hypothetical protein